MFIQIQGTPNPNTLKFLTGTPVLKAGFTLNVTNIEDSAIAPMALHLLQIKGTKSVFLAQNFISVTKENDISWDALKTLIMAAIIDHYMAGHPIVLESFYTPTTSKNDDINNGTNDEMNNVIVNQIKEIIETKIRPAVAEDGGDIIFDKFENGIVYLQLHGACFGCPSSTITLKAGIEKMLKHYVPEVISVESI